MFFFPVFENYVFYRQIDPEINYFGIIFNTAWVIAAIVRYSL